MKLGWATVRGRSMEPTYHDGDILLVGYGLRVRVYRTHLLRLPDGADGPRPLAVKRITRVDTPDAGGAPTWWAERDNPREGVDSWLVGAIPDADIVARVLCRLPTRLGQAVSRS